MAISSKKTDSSKRNAFSTSSNSTPINKASKRKREDRILEATCKTDMEGNDNISMVEADDNIKPEVSAKKIKTSIDEVLLIDRLHGCNALTALKDIQTKIELVKHKNCSDSEDPLNQFFREGGTARDILQALDQTGKVKSEEATVVFNACEAILLYLGSQILPAESNETETKNKKPYTAAKMQTLAVDITRELLQNHMRYLMMFLSESNSIHQTISSLRLLCAMVAGGGPIAGKEVLLKVDFEHPNIVGLSDRSINMNNMNIRKCHLEFLVAFFVAGNSSVIKDFLEKNSSRNHFASLFPGLIYDESDVVQLVVGTLQEKVINNLAISKTTKMQIFGVHNLKYLLALFGWRGPKGRSQSTKDKKRVNANGNCNENQDEDNFDEGDANHQAELENIRQVTRDFLISALTSVKKGVVFFDPSCGTSGNNQNHLLQNILQSMTSYKPWKEKNMSIYISEIVIKSMAVCPDQLRPYLTKSLQPLWTPKEESSTWKLVAIFLRNIFLAQDPLYIVKSIMHSECKSETSVSVKDGTNKLLVNVLGNIFCNDKIYREVVNPAINSTFNPVIIEGLELFGILMEKVESIILSDTIPELIKNQIIHRLSDKIIPLHALVEICKRELRNLNSETNIDATNIQNIKILSRILNFYWTNIPAYSNGNSDTVVKFLQDINELQEKHITARECGLFSYTQLILLRRLSSLATTSPSSFIGSGTLASAENLKVLVNLATSAESTTDENVDSSRNLALETMSRILSNARMIGHHSKNIENLSVWFYLVPHVNDDSTREKLKASLADCLSNSLQHKESLIQEVNALQSLSCSNDQNDTKNYLQNTDQLEDEGIFETLMCTPDLIKSMDDEKNMKVHIDKRASLKTKDVNKEGKQESLKLCPIQLQLIKCAELQDISPTYFTQCLLTLIAFQDDPKTLCNILLHNENELVPHKIQKQVKMLIDGSSSSVTIDDISGNEKFLLKQSIFTNLLNIKLSEISKTDNTKYVLQALEKFETLSMKKTTAEEILVQQSIRNTFDPLKIHNKEFNCMILHILKEFGTEHSRKEYLDKFIISIREYLQGSNKIPEHEQTDVSEIFDILEKTFLVLIDSPKKARILYDELHNGLPQVTKVVKEENTYLRCVVTNILNSFTKLYDVSELNNVEFITYVTNLMELILSSSSNDKYSESLLSTINTILSLSSKMIQTLSSVHVSLAIKSTLQSSNETLVHLIKKSDKLAKAFRKLALKETNLIKNLEKLLKATLASIQDKADVKSKFIKEIKFVIQPEIVQCLKGKDLNLPHHAIANLRNIVHIMKNNYNVEFEDINLKNYNIQSILQIQLVDELCGVSENDDEIKSLLMLPSLKKAIAELKKSIPEDDENRFELLFEVINKRNEQVHSLTSFYTNSDHNEVWTKFVKSVLKNSLKLVATGNNKWSMKRGIKALKTLTNVCRKLYGISNTRKKKTRGWKEKADKDCQEIFNMICGHSNFLSLLYSKNKSVDWQNLKFEILNLIVVLIESYSNICDSLELSVFLGAYNATLSSSDCAVLQIVQLCEAETSGEGKVSKLAMLQPLLWGQAAVSKYSTLHSKIVKATRTSEILELIEPERMLRSALKFPLHLKMDISENECKIDYDADHYDPRFFLPLICYLCAPSAFIDKHLKLIESGVLALVFGSFSSYDSHMRALGCTALSRIYYQIASAKKALSAEKQIWLHLIEVVKNGLAQQIDESDGIPKRVPSIATTFLAKTTTILSSPLDPMYTSISSFILAKPALDMFSVPDFLRLFHSQNIRHADGEDENINDGRINKTAIFNNTQHITERNWILTVIRDGLRDMLDFSILQQNFVFKIILTFYSTRNKNLRGDASKPIIINVLKLAVGIKDKALDLIKRHGFLLWVSDQATYAAEEISYKNNVEECEKEFEGLIGLVSHSWSAVRNIFNNANAYTEEKITLIEFENTAKDLLILTLKLYKKKSLSLNFFRALVKIMTEVETIRKTTKYSQTLCFNEEVSVPIKELVKAICYKQLFEHNETDVNTDDSGISIEGVQHEIECALNGIVDSESATIVAA